MFGFVDIFVLYPLFCASSKNSLIEVEITASNTLATLAFLLTSVCNTHVLFVPLEIEKKISKVELLR